MAQTNKKGISKAKSIGNKSSSINERVYLLIIIVITFVIYGNSINHYYALDDNMVTRQNQYVQKGVTGIKDIFTHDSFYGFFGQNKEALAGGRYRPLSLVTFAIEHDLFKSNPAVSHFINVLLYALTGVAIFLLLKRLSLNMETRYAKPTYLPFIITLLFIALPVHTEAVANIKGRDEILSMLFCIAATNLFIKYLDDGKKIKDGLMGFICLLLGLLSKENAITFCVIIPVTIWFFRKIIFKDFLPIAAAISLGAGIFLLLRMVFSGVSLGKESNELMNNPFLGMTALEKYSTILFTFGKYLYVLALPVTLTNDYYPYQIAVQTISSMGTLISVAIVIALLVIAFIQLRRKTLLSFCILFFAISFSVQSNLFFPVGTFMAERFLFMPSLGFCIILPFVLAKFLKTDLSGLSWSASKNFILLISVILVLYSFRTIDRNNDWKNNFILISADVKNSPNSAKAHYNMATEYLNKGEKSEFANDRNTYLQQAQNEFRKALKIYPGYPQAYYNLGLTYADEENNDSAEANFRKAAALRPAYQDAVNNIAICLVNRDKVDSALILLNQLVKEDSTFSRAYSNMGACYVKKNDYDKAIYYMQKALAFDPDNTSIANNIERVKAMKQ